MVVDTSLKLNNFGNAIPDSARGLARCFISREVKYRRIRVRVSIGI